MTQTLELNLADEAATLALGAALAQAPNKDKDTNFIIYLIGDLGAGKTTLVRGFLRALAYQGPVKSPTYTLIEPYSIAGRSYLHCDLYRLADAEELEYLGLRDELDQGAVLLVEWPERGKGLLPLADLTLNLAYAEDGRRCLLHADSPLGCSIIALLRNDNRFI